MAVWLGFGFQKITGDKESSEPRLNPNALVVKQQIKSVQTPCCGLHAVGRTSGLLGLVHLFVFQDSTGTAQKTRCEAKWARHDLQKVQPAVFKGPPPPNAPLAKQIAFSESSSQAGILDRLRSVCMSQASLTSKQEV